VLRDGQRTNLAAPVRATAVQTGVIGGGRIGRGGIPMRSLGAAAQVARRAVEGDARLARNKDIRGSAAVVNRTALLACTAACVVGGPSVMNRTVVASRRRLPDARIRGPAAVGIARNAAVDDLSWRSGRQGFLEARAP
jgi:hypothetical protein